MIYRDLGKDEMLFAFLFSVTKPGFNKVKSDS